MKTVYLDQNQWIALARAYHGKDPNPRMARVLEFVQDGSRQGTIALPLSAVHYMETARIRDPGRRSRLGAVMWEVSSGFTLASYGNIVRHELEVALSRRFSSVIPRPFKLVSKGVAHAFGMDYAGYRIPPVLRSALPDDLAEAYEASARSIMEKAAITGEGPDGRRMPPYGRTPHNFRFKEHLETLHPPIAQLPPTQWEDALHAMVLVDILDPINEVLERHGLGGRDLEGLGKDGLTLFVQDLPSRRVEIQLHRQILKNPSLKPRITDLEDWGALGPAAAHCDVVVCEKHFANLLLRDGFCPKARVITDVKDLLEVL